MSVLRPAISSRSGATPLSIASPAASRTTSLRADASRSILPFSFALSIVASPAGQTLVHPTRESTSVSMCIWYLFPTLRGNFASSSYPCHHPMCILVWVYIGIGVRVRVRIATSPIHLLDGGRPASYQRLVRQPSPHHPLYDPAHHIDGVQRPVIVPPGELVDVAIHVLLAEVVEGA